MNKPKLNPRIIYAFFFVLILIIEVLIALYVKDDYIRPYGGDVLVTVLICCFARIFVLKKISYIPLWVFIFALAVEMGQYFGLVYLIGLGDIEFFRILIGTGFSFIDIICYATGCLVFYLCEKIPMHYKREELNMSCKENSVDKASRKSICFLTHDFIIGGLENVLIEALKILKDDYDIQIISLYPKSHPEILERIPEGIKVVDRQMPPTKIAKIPYLSRFYFNRVIGPEKFDYIISLKSLERYACFCNRAKYKIHWCHNDLHVRYMSEQLDIRKRYEKFKLKILYKKHDMIWTVTQGIADELQDMFLLKNVYAIPNPIDCNEVLEKAMRPCDYKFDETKINIVLLGRVSREKGIFRTLNIMEDVFLQHPNVRLYIIGSGGGQERIKKMAQKRGFEERVIFLGAKSNPFPYLKQAQLLICPSLYESFGLAMMEAMLLKIPVITTNTTGGKYVTQNGKYARCINNDDEALKNAILDFLDDDEYGYSLEQAQKWVCQHDTKRFSERLVELLKKCNK